jgi:hypothetical protein
MDPVSMTTETLPFVLVEATSNVLITENDPIG